MRITCLTIDCSNPAAVAHFWNDALGCNGVTVFENGHSATCQPPSSGTILEFVRVPEGKTVKNRLHLGCAADSLGGLDSEIARLQTLGAPIAWEEDFPTEIASRYRNVILRDVEDNELCLGAGNLVKP